MTATVIGVYTRVAGVWERVNAGTPEGFSGPQTRQGGTWENAANVRTRQSGVWEFSWTNIDGELNAKNESAFDFDLSPYNLSAWLRYNGDGSMDRKHNGTITNGFSSWRPFDCGREYEIYFEDADPGNRELSLTRNTWLALTDPSTNYIVGSSADGSGYLFSTETQLVRIREKVSAPSLGNDSATITTEINAEV